MTKSLYLLFLAQAALAATPTLTDLQPRGAQQGKTFTLTLTGRELLEGSKIITTLPAVFTPLTATMKGFPWLVELRPDTPIGVYPIRVQNPSGLSNILFFTVGSFPEIDAQTLTGSSVKSLPITINGSLKGAVRDVFHISAKAGDHRIFEVEARRCGSAIDPVLELYDDKSTLLARNEDAPGIGVDSRIDYTFAHDGNYLVEVHDARFSKQDQNFYRLKIGTYAYPESVFPLGGRHGETVEFQFTTRAGITKTTVKLPDTGNFTTIAMPGAPVLPVPIALSDAIDGRITKPGDINRHVIKTTPGDSLLIELKSRELTTSRLDALITIYDSANKKLASAGDTIPNADVLASQIVGRTQGDPFLNFKVPPNTTEITIAVEDLAGRGGSDFGYRLSVQKQAEDFQLSASPAYINVPRGGTAQINVAADRRGYDGPIRATLANLPKGWVAEGGFIAPETIDASGARLTSRRGLITLTASPDSDPLTSDLVVVADAAGLHRQATGSGAVIDVASGTGLPDAASTDRQKSFTAPWLNLAMPAAIAKEPAATITVKQLKRTRMDEGDAFDFEWNIATKDKTIAMPKSVGVDPPGARELRIIDMKLSSENPAKGTFRITTTKSTAPATYDLVITANLMMDGVRETIVSRAIPWEVPNTEGADSAGKTTSGSN